MTDLLKKDKLFKWTEAQEQAFQALKNEFKKKPILVHFNYNKEEVINVDALKKAIEACLQ